MHMTTEPSSRRVGLALRGSNTDTQERQAFLFREMKKSLRDGIALSPLRSEGDTLRRVRRDEK